MLGQLVAAQFDLENAIAELERSGAPTDAVRSSLQSLGDLQRQIGTSDLAALSTLRGEIAASANTGRAIAQQSRAAASGDTADDRLASTSARTRATVQRVSDDLFERRIFDPYLQFDSEEAERAYRQREAARQEYIQRELAKGTPEGDLNASAATLAQVEDAGAHGADRSPEYQRTKDAILSAYDEQRTSMIAAGRPTADADARVAADVRTTLQARGMSSPEIDARLAASTNPADALRDPPPAPASTSSTSTELDDVAMALRAAGVTPPPSSTLPGHGLTASAQPVTELGGRLT